MSSVTYIHFPNHSSVICHGILTSVFTSGSSMPSTAKLGLGVEFELLMKPKNNFAARLEKACLGWAARFEAAKVVCGEFTRGLNPARGHLMRRKMFCPTFRLSQSGLSYSRLSRKSTSFFLSPCSVSLFTHVFFKSVLSFPHTFVSFLIHDNV